MFNIRCCTRDSAYFLRIKKQHNCFPLCIRITEQNEQQARNKEAIKHHNKKILTSCVSCGLSTLLTKCSSKLFLLQYFLKVIFFYYLGPHLTTFKLFYWYVCYFKSENIFPVKIKKFIRACIMYFLGTYNTILPSVVVQLYWICVYFSCIFNASDHDDVSAHCICYTAELYLIQY